MGALGLQPKAGIPPVGRHLLSIMKMGKHLWEDAVSDDAADFALQFEVPFPGDPGEDENERQRHILVRHALLFHLHQDDRVVSLLNDGATRAGLIKKAEAVHNSIRSLSLLYSFDDPGEFVESLCGSTDDILMSTENPNTAEQEMRRLSQFLKQLQDALADERNFKRLRDPLAKLIRDDLHLPWPWLCADLLALYWAQLTGAAYGLEIAVGLYAQKTPTSKDKLLDQLQKDTAESNDKSVARAINILRRRLAKDHAAAKTGKKREMLKKTVDTSTIMQNGSIGSTAVIKANDRSQRNTALQTAFSQRTPIAIIDPRFSTE
jgi:hypothetical protein